MKMRCLGLMLVATSAVAGSGSGTVTDFIPGSAGSNAIFVFEASSTSGSPACDTTQRFAIASTSPHYSTTVAAVMAAYGTGAAVSAVGLGTCNVLPNAEDLNYVCVGAIPC